MWRCVFFFCIMAVVACVIDVAIVCVACVNG